MIGIDMAPTMRYRQQQQKQQQSYYHNCVFNFYVQSQKNLVLVFVRIDHGNNVRMFGLGNKFDEFDNTRYSDYNHDDVVMKVYECDSVTYQRLGTHEERERKEITSPHYFVFRSAPYRYYDK